ncbi:unnamed protein product [Prunus armeniaca]
MWDFVQVAVMMARVSCGGLRSWGCRRWPFEDSLPKGRYDVTGTFQREGVISSRVARSSQASEGSLPKGSCNVIMPSEGKGAFRREVVTSSCLPKERCDVIACRAVSFQASEGSLSKGSCDVITPFEGKV